MAILQSHKVCPHLTAAAYSAEINDRWQTV